MPQKKLNAKRLCARHKRDRQVNMAQVYPKQKSSVKMRCIWWRQKTTARWKAMLQKDAAGNESYSMLNPPRVVFSNDHIQGHCSWHAVNQWGQTKVDVTKSGRDKKRAWRKVGVTMPMRRCATHPVFLSRHEHSDETPSLVWCLTTCHITQKWSVENPSRDMASRERCRTAKSWRARVVVD